MRNSGENERRFLIATLIILVRMCIGLIWASAGPLLLLMMQDYGISRGTVSCYASVASIITIISAVPAGILGAKMGARKIFTIGAFLQAASIFAPLCPNFLTLLLTRVLFAVGAAAIAPTATTIYAEWFNARELPLINGITMTLASLGNALAFVITIPAADAFSWRGALALYGLIDLTFTFMWLILGRGQPSIKADSLLRAKESLTNIRSVRSVLTQRATIILSLSLIGPFCLGSAIGSWLPTYYHEVFGMPLTTASSIVAISTVTGGISCLAGGVLSMWLGLRKPFLLIPGLLAGLAALGTFMFNNPAIIMVSMALFGILGSLSTASIFTIPMELPEIGPRMGAIVLALALGVGNIGSFIGPLIVGYLADLSGSYLPGLITCCILSLSLFVGWIFLPETGPRARQIARQGAN